MSKVKKSISILVMALCLTISLLFVGVNFAHAQNTTNEFSLMEGASIRLNTEHYGIKYKATIKGEPVKDVQYKMMIVPSSYLTKYAVDIENNNNDYYKGISSALQKEKGDNYYLAVMNCIPIKVTEGNYYIQGSLTNLKYTNLNRNFDAFAFYTDSQDNNVYATKTDNIRNIVNIASKALNSGSYVADTPEFDILNKIITNGVNSFNNVTIENKDNPIDLQISLDAQSISLVENQTKQVNVLGLNGIDIAVEWSSDDETIASVIDGNIKGVSIGQTIVHAKVLNNDYSVAVEVSQAVAPSVIAVQDCFDAQNPADAVFTVDLLGNEFNGLKGQDNYPITQNDYTFVDNTLTIKKQYLIKLHSLMLDNYTFTLDTMQGTTANLTINYLQPSNKVINSGFESGDLFGWNSYGIWKGEDNMTAFVNDRVVTGKYFDNKCDYNREGTYNLGIHGDFENGNYKGVSKDSGQERMGILRSSNFVLGGSGYISFMLGGGKIDDFAYLSIFDSATNTELYRFGNPKFNSQLDGQNTEARLFKYFVDASAHIGKTLYVTITENASNEWCVLALDSLVTYYENIPTFEQDQLAVNIVPVIEYAGAPDIENQIKNCNNITSMSAYQQTHDIIKTDGSRVRSDKSGDGSMGVLRTSAFTLKGENKILFFDWGGGIKHDKQIFVSVRQVGSNREVMRLTRRNNLSGHEGTNTDKHWIDLSQLDENQEYYVEFSDNRGGGWGLFVLGKVWLEKGQGVDGDKATQAYELRQYNQADNKLEGVNSDSFYDYIQPSL